MGELMRQGNVHFIDNDAAMQRVGQIEGGFCDLLAIAKGLEATVQGEQFTPTRDFLVRQLHDHIAALEQLVLPHN